MGVEGRGGVGRRGLTDSKGSKSGTELTLLVTTCGVAEFVLISLDLGKSPKLHGETVQLPVWEERGRN